MKSTKKSKIDLAQERIQSENQKLKELEELIAPEITKEKSLENAITTKEFKKQQYFDFLFQDTWSAALEHIKKEGNSSSQNWCIPPDVKTASQIDGIAYGDEVVMRLYASDVMFRAGILLRLPMLTISSGLELFHRYSHR